jgi:hypothetical protein
MVKLYRDYLWRVSEQFLYLYLKNKPNTFVLKTNGEMAEWLNAAVLKTVKDASPSGVRIPISPQKDIKPQISLKIDYLRFFSFKIRAIYPI